MSNRVSKQSVAVMVGLAWCYAVIISYGILNRGYFSEKFSVFGHFILRHLGF